MIALASFDERRGISLVRSLSHSLSLSPLGGSHLPACSLDPVKKEKDGVSGPNDADVFL